MAAFNLAQGRLWVVLCLLHESRDRGHRRARSSGSRRPVSAARLPSLDRQQLGRRCSLYGPTSLVISMSSELEALDEMLREAEALLRSYDQIHWADWLANDAKLIRFHDGFGVEHLLSAYGGMGSLNDVVLQRISAGAGVQVAHDDNERFDELRREIYDLAKRLNKWVNVGD